MEAISNIMNRRSIRKFCEKPINEQDLHTILAAGMAGPSAVNSRDWSFIVVRDRKTLDALAGEGPSRPLHTATLAIIVLGDLSRSFPPMPDFWTVDGSIATQNMILAAHALGIGSVWLGCYPIPDRMKKVKEVFQLPDNIEPHSVIAMGYPEDPKELESNNKNFFEEDRVHLEKW